MGHHQPVGAGLVTRPGQYPCRGAQLFVVGDPTGTEGRHQKQWGSQCASGFQSLLDQLADLAGVGAVIDAQVIEPVTGHRANAYSMALGGLGQGGKLRPQLWRAPRPTHIHLQMLQAQACGQRHGLDAAARQAPIHQAERNRPVHAGRRLWEGGRVSDTGRRWPWASTTKLQPCRPAPRSRTNCTATA